MIEDEELYRTVRRLLGNGGLPSTPPDRVWGGAGSGAPCKVCGRTVGRDEVELEIEYGRRLHEHRVFHVHVHCHHVWERELARGLPPSVDHGTLPLPEHGTPQSRGSE